MDTSPHVPAYVQIADDLRRKIQRGELSSGDKVPSESQLCEEWRVSGITARAAIAVLRGEGLVQSVRGKGTFVRKETALVRLAPQRYFRQHHKPTYVQEAERANRPIALDRRFTEARASDSIAERLGIEADDPVTLTNYFIRMSGQPVSMSESWEPLALTRSTDIERPTEGPYASKGIVERFDTIGYHVDEVEEILDCRMPTPTEVRQLAMPSGVPVVAIEQTWRAAGIPVCTVDVVYPGDRYELHYRMAIK